MDARSHWETIYSSKAANKLSWYRPHLESSLALIQRANPSPAARIIDVGGGESTLAGDLLTAGYSSITVLDISQTAIDANRRRLGVDADAIQWIAADITGCDLEPAAYDVWHDRAVFHFLITTAGRDAYLSRLTRALKPGGHVIIGTFGPEGPVKCSGLDVVRYDAQSLHDTFGPRFRLLESAKELHQTPFGTTQQFLYCHCILQ